MAKVSVQDRVKDAVAHKKAGGSEPEMPYIYSPQGYMLLLTAVMIDILGLFFAFLSFLTGTLATPLEVVPDIMGMATLGFWYYLKTGEVAVGERFKKLFKKQRLTWLGEFLPFVGAVPFWTLWVVKTLKK